MSGIIDETWERGAGGVGDAVQRLTRAEADDNLDRAVRAATEALMWVDSLADNAGRDNNELLTGVRWARNRGVHSLVNLTAAAAGRTYPRTYPLRYRHLVWAAASTQVVEQTPNHQGKYQPAYESALVGQPVRATIVAAARALGVDLD